MSGISSFRGETGHLDTKPEEFGGGYFADGGVACSALLRPGKGKGCEHTVEGGGGFAQHTCCGGRIAVKMFEIAGDAPRNEIRVTDFERGPSLFVGGKVEDVAEILCSEAPAIDGEETAEGVIADKQNTWKLAAGSRRRHLIGLEQ